MNIIIYYFYSETKCINVRATLYCTDCDEKICGTCSKQCHNGHEKAGKKRLKIKTDGDNLCKCSHQHPKLKFYSKAFEAKELKRLKEQLLAKHRENWDEGQKKKGSDFEKFEKSGFEAVEKMVENMTEKTIIRKLNEMKKLEHMKKASQNKSSLSINEF